MGLADLALLNLVQRLGSWFSESSPSPMSSCCHDSPRCRSCRKCMQQQPGGDQPRLCFHAISRDGLADGPQSPLPGIRNSRIVHLAESPSFSSPRSLYSRSDEEEDGGEHSGKHYFTPSSDASDIDSVSVSTGNNELYSFKSVNSSPLDSPSRIGGCDASPSPLDQDAPGYFRKAEAEDLLDPSGYDNLSVYRNHETKKAQQPFDFQNNRLIWDVPPPEDENDDVETGLCDDDDDGDCNAFTSGSFGCDALGFRDKASDANKENLRDAVRGHFRALVSQLLKAEGIAAGGESCGGEGWLDIVTSLAWQAATYVKLDTSRGGSMDPGNYVKVKCVSSGKPSDSTFVKGVVCTKNVRHKRMISQHKNPRLFLLGGALEYQKVANKLASINTVIEQESDHLKVSVSKIEAHRPNVLLVEKSVSSYAQQYLLAKEISLVLNVKKPLLERIARCTGAHIAPSIDDIALARLGHCEVFHVEKLFEDCPSGEHPNKKTSKTLMFFEGCPRRLGCTVLLRGDRDELRKVKHVFQYASFAAYHLSRETSFLADEGASLPKVPLDGPIAIPANLVNPDTCMSKTSSIPNAHQTIEEEHKKLNTCIADSVNCFLPCLDISSLQGDIISDDTSCLSPAHFELEGDHSIGTKESFELSDSLTDKEVPQGEVVENTFEERGVLANHRQLRKGEEEKITNTDCGNEAPREYFSAADNQSILVSLSTTSILKGTICEPSQLLRIKFYGSFDKPLGRYLRDDLFDQAACCRSCKEPAEAHVRCYTHQHGSLTISVRRHPSIKLPGERDERIWMWHRCLKCEHKDGVPPAARRVVMSDAAWGLSFGKFLELSFSNHATANRIASCGHSLQKDCLRFYGFGNMMAFFRYGPVDILSIQLPPLVLNFTCHAQQEWVVREADAISRKMELLHSEVFNVLQRIEQKIAASENEPTKASIHNYIAELKSLLKREKDQYDIVLQLSASENNPSFQGAVDILELNRLRRCLLMDSHTWDRRLCLLDSFSKSKGSVFKLRPQLGEVAAHGSLREWRDESICKDVKTGNSPQEILTKSLSTSKQHKEFNLHFNCDPNNLIEMDWSIGSAEGYMGLAGLNLVSGNSYLGDSEAKEGGEALTGTSLERLPSAASTLSDKIDSLWSGNPESDSVGSTTLMDNPLYRKVLSPVRVNSFDSALRFRDRLHGRSSPASMHLSSVRSFDASGDMARMDYSQRPPNSVKVSNSHQSHNPSLISSAAHMMDEGARLLLPQAGFDDLVIVLYDNEPTTIISYAISSQEHADFISDKLDQHDGLCEVGRINSFGRPLVSQFHSDDEPQSLRRNLFLDLKENHFRISFDDDSSIPADKVKFSVTCYFAKQFDELRKKCCPDEADFLRSLSRCKRWNAQGGKSNAYFAKTLDERFVIKQVTKTELDSFEDFAAEYFNYLTESINSGSPTCLAKVLGIYQVTVKHLKGGREMKLDLMVMENLFFGRKLSRVYDLKGSSRSRYNPNTSGDDKVLLDLNLLETLRTKPIFLGSKAKRSLERAVWNDTSFLASIDVMDYSLLVGVDDARKELVIGIIDFMRQYTWDKHLETWVKASGILGGPKNASPTVVSPLQYKKRFRKAMSKYFLTVPDQWSAS
ncbi:putative 1-phosphatidylinositol-3-phosphate 5-kinase FAB1C isoform X1 [Iris pallida]|uniref:1-phosphatidylinositol-3-phosphate 5-kinase n=1 Tax=Iris pallida TaxID=29817 RepID=A0AAX6DZ07_IRIPA|nr:putative 1-phosphatidylinositol-3-phosphate 5-kinase FAB1C isoform X1 [Iris pallida]